MSSRTSRRQFLQKFGISAAALPFLGNLAAWGNPAALTRKQRLVVVFSPNGTVPWNYWPDAAGELTHFKPILAPLEPFRAQTMVLKGVCDQIRGDGDSHMRGMGCLLTGVELFPGNIQGGSDTPAGWAKGHSIDQEIKAYLQSQEHARTRFGSLEFGVMVPDRADTWTRMCYTAANRPITPIDDPYQMFNKLYGQAKNNENLVSVLDSVSADLTRLSGLVGQEDRRLLEEHATLVRTMETELRTAAQSHAEHAVPELEPGVEQENDRIPFISKMQIDLMLNAFKADFARIASLQITNSVGQPKMRWLGIEEDHHALSHDGDDNEASQDKLTRINTWYCEQVAYLVKQLAVTPEPHGPGSMLDNTLVVWTNELGQGNSHTLDNIPFVLIGGGLDFKMGRSLDLKRVPHNRLLLSLAHGFGHHISKFGNPDYCVGGPLTGLS